MVTPPSLQARMAAGRRSSGICISPVRPCSCSSRESGRWRSSSLPRGRAGGAWPARSGCSRFTPSRGVGTPTGEDWLLQLSKREQQSKAAEQQFCGTCGCMPASPTKGRQASRSSTSTFSKERRKRHFTGRSKMCLQNRKATKLSARETGSRTRSMEEGKCIYHLLEPIFCCFWRSKETL
ncbi:uncharacterized protein [Miscanthus floridulus]|uniref:uncharacterized protein isoform X3 n=1 Tax=Miscanthus floridulus TaxID=154761 RepID=UPI003458F31A